MKARLLKKLLNDTTYNVHNHGEYIGIGSALCHNLISVDKKTLEMKYALDTFRQGRASLKDESELLFIWDKLTELIESGEIKDIIEGKDVIENPVKVYTIMDGQLHECLSEALGYPNITDDGYLQYNNTFFATKEEAVKDGIEEYTDRLLNDDERIERIQGELYQSMTRRTKHKLKLQKLIYHLYKLEN